MDVPNRACGDVPGVRRGPHRVESGRQLSAGESPSGRETTAAIPRGQWSLPGARRLRAGLLRVAMELRPRPEPLAQEHQGRRRSLGTASVLVLQHAALGRHRRCLGHRDRDRSRDSCESKARRLARHDRQHDGIYRWWDSPVRLSSVTATGLRGVARLATSRRGLPARPARFRPAADDQVFGPAGHRRGDPDDRWI